MKFWHLGLGTFRIRTKRGVVVTDPCNNQNPSLKAAKSEADIITLSQPDPSISQSAITGNKPFIIAAPGEYEIGGINILGIPSYQDKSLKNERSNNVIYLIHTEGIKVVHLGQLSHRLAKTSLDYIDSPDILILPLGEEGKGLEVKYAAEIVRQIEAKIIFPIHYIEESIDLPLNKVEIINKFLKETGNTPKIEPELIVNKNDFLSTEEKLVLLENRIK